MIADARPKASNPQRYRQQQEEEQTKAAAGAAAAAPSSSYDDPQRRREEQRKPRASNPRLFRNYFQAADGGDAAAAAVGAGKGCAMRRPASQTAQPKQRQPEESARRVMTVAENLVACGEKDVPVGSWVHVSGVPPMSSLDAMLAGVRNALNEEKQRGIVDLDAPWDPNEQLLDDNGSAGTALTVPFLSFPDDGEDDRNPGRDVDDWVKQAKVILSPFARPTGWKLQFENRSIVYALLVHANETPIYCASKRVRIQQWSDAADDKSGKDDSKYAQQHVYNEYPQLSDATLRVENCPDSATPMTIINLFSRFDLRQDGGPPVVQWSGRTSDGKVPPSTWLVHFADPSWARAALRETQGANVAGRVIRLAQYPRQIL